MRNIRVLFVDAKNWFSEIETRLRPLWPAYLAAYVEKNTTGNQYVFHFLWKKSVRKEITDFRPDIVAISSVAQNYKYAIEISMLAKKIGATVILGGPHISSAPESLYCDIDVGVMGEGEITFLELLEAYRLRRALRPESLLKIKGIVFHYRGRPHITEERPNIEDLSILPKPKRSLIGYARRAHIVTARGCNYKCIFCAATRHWRKVRYFPIEQSLSEIDELVRHGAKVIRINDDNFAASANRLRQFSKAIRARGYHKKIKFSCWARSNDLNVEKVALLKSMNIVSVVMGLESANQASLDFLKGHVTVEDNQRAVALLKAAGIQTNADFIIGAPKETKEQILSTYNFIKQSDLDFVTVNILTPMPGTPLWDMAKKKGLVGDGLEVADYNFRYKFGRSPHAKITISENLTTEELFSLYRRFHRLEWVMALKALPTSPWRAELPWIFLKKMLEFFMGFYMLITKKIFL